MCRKVKNNQILFYSLISEHVKSKSKKMTAPDYSKLLQETSYEQRMLGNIMFNGKLIQANANFTCFMTINTENPAYMEIPEAYRVCFSLISFYIFYNNFDDLIFGV